MKKLIGSFVVLLGAAVIASAHTPLIDKREHHQQARIREGLKSGELTRREFLRLESEQSRIRFAEAKAKSDGIVTCRERLRLNRMLDRASRDIYRQKHDGQDRNP
jgi:hypothetical protein